MALGYAALLLMTILASLGLTRLSLAYARRRSLLDVPNERSSHVAPTPRGGGLGMTGAYLAAVAALTLHGAVDHEMGTALLGGGALVAAIGWVDDHRSLAARWRVLTHSAAALWALWWLGGMPTVDLGTARLTLGAWGWPIATMAVVWLTNLYNFMDGIDGLAGTQAVTTGSVAALLVASRDPGLTLGCLALVAAALGFLWWNRPPARIFMGDVGSGLLGYCFAVLAIAGERHGSLPALLWTLLLAVFVWDATFTLGRRVIRGERWYEAHRSHGYQCLVQKGWSHAQVTLAVLMLNCVVLAPLAWWVNGHPRWLCGAAVAVAAGCWLLWRWSTDSATTEVGP